MPVGDILPEIALILTAVAVLLTASFTPHRLQWIGAVLALIGLAVAAALTAGQIGAHRLTFSGTWALDGASTYGRLVILAATAFCVVLTPRWLADDKRHGEYYAILLFSALGALVLAAAADLLELVMGVLLSSVTGYTLAAWHRDWALSVEAGMKYFLVGALANVILLIGVTLMTGMLGGFGFADLAPALAAPGAASPLLLLGVALVVIGLSFKLGAVPAHAWMPDVAEGAPAPAAAFLTVVPKIGAAIALARLVSLVPPDALAIRPVVAVISVATMTLGNLAALWQDDVRRLIGWSSVSQSGYALMAVVVVSLSGGAVSALLAFLTAYAVGNLAAFAVVTHLRGRTDRAHYAGLARTRPVAATVLILAFLSLVGIPPLVGFFGKLTLFLTTIDGGYAWLAAVAVANTVASLFYYLRVVGPMVFEGDDARRPAVLGRWTAVAVLTGGVLTVALGLAAEPGLAAFGAARLLP
ncbi:NADH-quinone oxidoreductase subunit N [Caenispirillum salinarum]|uniref:NADH-quinone oxidoreductase subunit N n=1 Tax=Caenispirillum salinarum TaxID=859058 RepID=UPI00384FBA3C